MIIRLQQPGMRNSNKPAEAFRNSFAKAPGKGTKPDSLGLITGQTNKQRQRIVFITVIDYVFPNKYPNISGRDRERELLRDSAASRLLLFAR